MTVNKTFKPQGKRMLGKSKCLFRELEKHLWNPDTQVKSCHNPRKCNIYGQVAQHPSCNSCETIVLLEQFYGNMRSKYSSPPVVLSLNGELVLFICMNFPWRQRYCVRWQPQDLFIRLWKPTTHGEDNLWGIHHSHFHLLQNGNQIDSCTVTGMQDNCP